MPHPREVTPQLSAAWTIPHPWTLLENARPVLFRQRCRISIPRHTPDRIIAIVPLATSTPGHPTHKHHNTLHNLWIQNATSGISSKPWSSSLILTFCFNTFAHIL